MRNLTIVGREEKIKFIDKNEFCNLYGYNIPIHKEAEYYINNLIKSKEFETIDQRIDDFYFFQNQIAEGSSPKSFKYKLSDIVKEELRKLGIKDKLDQINMNGHSFARLTPSYEPGYFYVSLDLNEANWNVYKYFGGLETNLNWGDWLRKEFSAPDAIVNSKIFRQIIFGHLSPGKVAKLQEQVTNDNYAQVMKAMERGEVEGVVGKSSDELILKFTEEQVMFDDDPISFIKSILPRKFKIFTVDEKEFLNKKVEIHTVYEPISLEPKYKTLKNVPGNQFWIFFKKFILEEEIEERDLLFFNDKMLAKWVI